MMNQPNVVDRLNLKQKLFQESIFPSAVKVANGFPLYAPLVIELDSTSFCDFSCPECISIDVLNKKKFSTSQLNSLAKEFVHMGIKAVILIGGGEPLAHPAIGEVIKILGKAGVSIGITTNGSFIHRYLEEIVEYVSWLRVSVDAGTEHTFGLFRPHKSTKNAFNSIIKNIELLSQRGMKNLGFSFLIMIRSDIEHGTASNYEEIYSAGLLAKKIGCDYFEIKSMYDNDHFLISIDKEKIESIKNQIHELRKIEDEKFKVISPSAFRKVLDSNAFLQPKAYTNCPISELRTLITPSGVYVCPYHRGDESMKLGNLTDNSFEELWNSEDRINKSNAVNPKKDCLFYCIRHESNLEINLIGNPTQGIQNVELLPDTDLFI